MFGSLHGLLGALHIGWYLATKRPHRLDRAIRLLGRAVDTLPAGHQDRSMVVAALGNGLLLRYERCGDPADLAAAVRRGEEAARVPGVTAGDRAAALANVAGALRTRFLRTGDLDDLDRAVECGLAAVRDAGDRVTVDTAVTNLALARLTRYEVTGNLADLLAAVGLAREPVTGRVAAMLHRGGRRNVLCAALTARYQHTDDPDDLAAAITAGREALAGLSALDRNRAAYAGNLSIALRTAADPALLDEAVAAAEDAVRSAGPARRDRAAAGVEVGPGHHERAAAGVEVGPGHHERAAAGVEVGPGHHERAAAGVEVGPGHHERAAAGVEVGPGHVDRAVHLSDLALGLWLRHRATGGVEDLRRAVATAEEALEDIPARSRNRPVALYNLAMMAAVLHDVTADPAALARAERAGTEALGTVGAGDPMRGMMLRELATTLLRRPDDDGHRERARALLREAAGVDGPALALAHALRPALLLGDLAAGDGDAADALLGYRRAVRLLPVAAWPGLRRALREARLAEAAGVAGAAAAQAIAAGADDAGAEAVELLELGRSVMWSQHLDRGADLGRLRAAHPVLADRIDALRIWFESGSPPA